jgi:uncharacterized RDD family membrane protein YckC
MKSHVTKALRLYKWLSLAFAAVYIPLIVYDDFVFIRKFESLEQAGVFIGFSLWIMLAYFLVFTLAYGAAASIVILGLRLVAAARRG